ncbi:kinase-like protein [Gonapodya prolifera JEL478]|uniref:Kinase-like protein n=1 Tax=Gonapodya prolifera (strain JEL478) TaxID=1344416 RepID=A0A138ZYA5_GONPJ|nr:kinase-like protein [Gonapodya prolifera JEL478]|eukprot:KXS09477.1 kinase-like protein [Gonapodya prolifera JEL478]
MATRSLIIAIEGDDIASVKSLLQSGADASKRKRVTLSCRLIMGITKKETIEAESALAIAIMRGNPHIVAALLDAGADPGIPVQWRLAATCGTWEKLPPQLWDRMKWGYTCTFPTALSLAVCRGISMLDDNKNVYTAGINAAATDGTLFTNKKGADVAIQNPTSNDDRQQDVNIVPNIYIVARLLRALGPNAANEVLKSEGMILSKEMETLLKDPSAEAIDVILAEMPPSHHDEVTLVAPAHEDAGRSSMKKESSSVSAHGLQERPQWEIDASAIVIRRFLGSGGYGNVFLGQYFGDVVIKKLSRIGSGDVLKDFRNEVEIWNRLRHPRVVRFVGANFNCPEPFIVSEYMRNGNLEEFLTTLESEQSSTIRSRDVVKLDLLRDAAQGLAYLHSLKPPIIHADVKPGNILVNGDCRAGWCDFGFSKLAEQLLAEDWTHTGERPGTWNYMSPERLRGEGTTAEGDVYAFGLTIFKVWTGSVMFEPLPQNLPASEVGGIYSHIADGRARPALDNATVPAEIRSLVKECCVFDPEKRPTAEKVAAVLASISVD